MVVIFNNDHNSADEVVNVIMEATACDIQEAYIECGKLTRSAKLQFILPGMMSVNLSPQ